MNDTKLYALTDEQRETILGGLEGQLWSMAEWNAILTALSTPVEQVDPLARLEEWRNKKRPEGYPAHGKIDIQWGKVEVDLFRSAPDALDGHAEAKTLAAAINAALDKVEG